VVAVVDSASTSTIPTSRPTSGAIRARSRVTANRPTTGNGLVVDDVFCAAGTFASGEPTIPWNRHGHGYPRRRDHRGPWETTHIGCRRGGPLLQGHGHQGLGRHGEAASRAASAAAIVYAAGQWRRPVINRTAGAARPAVRPSPSSKEAVRYAEIHGGDGRVRAPGKLARRSSVQLQQPAEHDRAQAGSWWPLPTRGDPGPPRSRTTALRRGTWPLPPGGGGGGGGARGPATGLFRAAVAGDPLPEVRAMQPLDVRDPALIGRWKLPAAGGGRSIGLRPTVSGLAGASRVPAQAHAPRCGAPPQVDGQRHRPSARAGDDTTFRGGAGSTSWPRCRMPLP
jgi:hypothetical protein